jgi:hypothetical protein
MKRYILHFESSYNVRCEQKDTVSPSSAGYKKWRRIKEVILITPAVGTAILPKKIRNAPASPNLILLIITLNLRNLSIYLEGMWWKNIQHND